MIDNTPATAYKLARFLNGGIKEYVNLPDIYTIRNSKELAQELEQLNIGDHHRMVILDVKDLHVNLPKQGIIQAPTIWLYRNKTYNDDKVQILQLLNVIIEQNYFQHNNKYYKPANGIAMGSPISGTLAEIHLKLIEEYHINHWMDNGDLPFYKRYVDDIFIIVDTRKIDDNIIRNRINSIDSNLEFKLTSETNNSINYLDMAIIKYDEGIEINIYRKPTTSNITIHHNSNHTQDHKDAAYRYYIHRMTELPNTNHAKT